MSILILYTCFCTVETTISNEIGIFCPHCNHKLVKHYDRKGYVVYVCNNKKCSYYRNNKNLFKEGKTDILRLLLNKIISGIITVNSNLILIF